MQKSHGFAWAHQSWPPLLTTNSSRRTATLSTWQPGALPPPPSISTPGTAVQPAAGAQLISPMALNK